MAPQPTAAVHQLLIDLEQGCKQETHAIAITQRQLCCSCQKPPLLIPLGCRACKAKGACAAGDCTTLHKAYLSTPVTALQLQHSRRQRDTSTNHTHYLLDRTAGLKKAACTNTNQPPDTCAPTQHQHTSLPGCLNTWRSNGHRLGCGSCCGLPCQRAPGTCFCCVLHGCGPGRETCRSRCCCHHSRRQLLRLLPLLLRRPRAPSLRLCPGAPGWRR